MSVKFKIGEFSTCIMLVITENRKQHQPLNRDSVFWLTNTNPFECIAINMKSSYVKISALVGLFIGLLEKPQIVLAKSTRLSSGGNADYRNGAEKVKKKVDRCHSTAILYRWSFELRTVINDISP